MIVFMTISNNQGGTMAKVKVVKKLRDYSYGVIRHYILGELFKDAYKPMTRERIVAGIESVKNTHVNLWEEKVAEMPDKMEKGKVKQLSKSAYVELEKDLCETFLDQPFGTKKLEGSITEFIATPIVIDLDEDSVE